MGLDNDPLLEETETSMVKWAWAELSSSWLNLGLTAAIVYLLYKILFQKEQEPPTPPEPPKPPVKKQDMTLQQLRVYDGESEACDGSICVAVNGKIFDVTRGKRFYGPGGPYSSFAGRDASRGLATFSVEPVSDEYDDLSDLKPSEMEQVKEWERRKPSEKLSTWTKVKIALSSVRKSNFCNAIHSRTWIHISPA